MDQELKLTVVTVVKDDSTGFERTLNSLNVALGDLDSHERGSVEYVVIDSSTNTNEIPELIRSESIPTQLRWVEPHGVYSAMNAGLGVAQGKYVYFLNAGDQLFGPGSLHLILEALANEPAWVFGQVIFQGSNGVEATSSFDYQSEKKHFFGRGKFPAHQGTIAARIDIERLGGFDAGYKIAADYKLLLQLSQFADPIEIEHPVATFHLGGISSSMWQESLEEFHQARVEVFELKGAALVAEQFRWRTLFVKMWLARKLGRVSSESK